MEHKCLWMLGLLIILLETLLDFNYNDPEKKTFIGMSSDNYCLFTTLYEYDCFIQNRIKEEKGNMCLDECSLECPPSTVLGKELF
jgi:hypothetical protein